LLLIRAFLHTGLFIVAHDAMHGSLVPDHRPLNRILGGLALALYACIPYGRCRTNHLLHHRSPGHPDDPDFHDGRHTHPLRWYITFMGGYLSAGQMGSLLALWSLVLLVLSLTTPHPLATLTLFWIVPLVLSSIQLFLFGTYLPHRSHSSAKPGFDQVQSTSLPPVLSFLTCFHFGYHREHHHHPNVPWYALPSLRRPACPRSAAEAGTR
jgi:beta-carotene ketolase (CrtW type)